MTKAAQSIVAFGVYGVLTGLGFLFMPNVVLGTFGFMETSESWIRVVGCLALVISYYYIQAGRQELTSFFRFTLHTRSVIFFAFAGLVVFGLAEPMLIIFGVVDLLGALWTAWALRQDQKAA